MSRFVICRVSTAPAAAKSREINKVFVAPRLRFAVRGKSEMVLKIDVNVKGDPNVLVLSGRIGSDDVQTLKSCMEDFGPVTSLDLAQVQLVNLDAVRFLAECEKRGIEVRNCRPHLRAWMFVEQQRVGDLE